MGRSMAITPLYPWQAEDFKHLSAYWEAGRPPQALLLQGLQGIGKSALARHLACWLLCEQPQRPCGHCDPCQWLEAKTHPDYRWVAPNEKGVISVDAIREINAFVEQTAGAGKQKVVVIDQAQAMNPSAANAFLKTLEEPSGLCTLILVADQSRPLLPTIRSRCQLVRLGLPAPQAAERWLEQQGIEKASFWCRLAQGAPVRALAWATGEGNRDFLKKTLLELEHLAQKRLTPSELIKPWADRLDFALPVLIQWFYDIQYVQSHVPERAAFAGHPSLRQVTHQPLPWQCLTESLQLYQAYRHQAGQYSALQLEAILARWQQAY